MNFFEFFYYDNPGFGSGSKLGKSQKSWNRIQIQCTVRLDEQHCLKLTIPVGTGTVGIFSSPGVGSQCSGKIIC